MQRGAPACEAQLCAVLAAVGSVGGLAPRWPRLFFCQPRGRSCYLPTLTPVPAPCRPLPAGDCFERPLGSTRKGTVRKVLEVPVWGLRRALASVDG